MWRGENHALSSIRATFICRYIIHAPTSRVLFLFPRQGDSAEGRAGAAAAVEPRTAWRGSALRARPAEPPCSEPPSCPPRACAPVGQDTWAFVRGRRESGALLGGPGERGVTGEDLFWGRREPPAVGGEVLGWCFRGEGLLLESKPVSHSNTARPADRVPQCCPLHPARVRGGAEVPRSRCPGLPQGSPGVPRPQGFPGQSRVLPS